MQILCIDLEGVLVPEIWIAVADSTGIDAFRATTRDIPDYDELMKRRLALMDENGLGLADVQSVVDKIGPLDGAVAFLDDLRPDFQVVILSDTFYEFALPLMRKLSWPTLFCHRLEVDEKGRVVDYHLRIDDQKRMTIEALRGLNFRTIAVGDSYNDTSMLGAADAGILFCPPDNVIAEFPQFPITRTYDELREAFLAANERE